MSVRSLAKIELGVDLEIEDHGLLIPEVFFNYEDHGVQGLPMILDQHGGDFIKRLLKAVGVRKFSALAGKSCWVTYTNDSILKIEPLHKNDGEVFDIAAWKEGLRER